LRKEPDAFYFAENRVFPLSLRDLLPAGLLLVLFLLFIPYILGETGDARNMHAWTLYARTTYAQQHVKKGGGVMSRPVYPQDPGRLAFLLLLTMVFFTGLLAGAGMAKDGKSRGFAKKLREAFAGWEFPGWTERWTASRHWFSGAGKKIAGFTGEVKEVLARPLTRLYPPAQSYPNVQERVTAEADRREQVRSSAGERARARNLQGKKRIHFPVSSWEKQVLLPDRIGFILPAKAGVYAVAGGSVAELLPVRGGWRVRLDHGGGWSSVYYPLSGLTISHGWQVRAGEKLGSAVTGENGETKLFWEVWRGEEAVPPRCLLARRSAQGTGK
jgi:hypothetical protein